jgi:hypothetical protein
LSPSQGVGNVYSTLGLSWRLLRISRP